MVTKLRVHGMGCDGCVDIVSGALAEAPGAGDVDVDLASGEATVEGDVDPDELVGKVERAGYDAEVVGSEPVADDEE
ncbi:heavy-metal-associated domain-containing protein [Halarchaeum salinum]|uniref:Heavy-metal-associated domain-containing protein n=1 Tax=Halarchaeum salinum TaxID=489912 RepID=A0AAV3S693_9EURY